MTAKSVAVVDLDWCKYTAASASEKRSIVVTHTPTGWSDTFNNRTDFWGRGKAIRGWLAEHAEEHNLTLDKGDYELQDVQTPEPIENALFTAKRMVENALNTSGATEAIYVLGKGDGHRVARSTMRKYKDRSATKPLMLNEVVEYLTKKYKPIIVEDIEADDMVVQLCYGKKDHFVIGEDKDNYSQPIRFFNVNRPEEGIVDCTGFGSLWLDEKTSPLGIKTSKVRGTGRMHLYWQMAWGDDVDTYRANALSDVIWGDKSAYHALKDCKNDKEAWEALIGVFKKLYPSPIATQSWRGEDIVVDHLYALQEMFEMAKMLKTPDELRHHPQVVDVCKKLGVDYE